MATKLQRQPITKEMCGGPQQYVCVRIAVYEFLKLPRESLLRVNLEKLLNVLQMNLVSPDVVAYLKQFKSPEDITNVVVPFLRLTAQHKS